MCSLTVRAMYQALYPTDSGIRDIPADYIILGSKKSNLREEVDKYQKAFVVCRW